MRSPDRRPGESQRAYLKRYWIKNDVALDPTGLPRLAGGAESAIPTVEAVVAIVKENTRGTVTAPPTAWAARVWRVGEYCTSGGKTYKCIKETEASGNKPPEATYWKEESPVFAYMPVMGPKYKPDLKYLEDDAFRGSMVKSYNMIPGLRHDSLAWDTYLYMDTVPNLIRALLGSPDTVTAAETETEILTGTEGKAGESTIKTVGELKAGAYIVIGKAGAVGSIETHKVKAVTKVKAGEYTVELEYPLAYNQPAKTKIEGLTKHEFSLLNNTPTEGNQPPSYSLFYFSGEENWRALPGGQLDTFSLSGTADTLPKAAVSFMAFLSQTPAQSAASLNTAVAFSTAQAATGWNFTAAIGGTQQTNVEEWSLEMKRNVKPIEAITGTQNPYQIFASYLEITGKLKVLANQTSPLLQAYLKGETKSLDFTISDVKEGWAINLHCSEQKFPQGEVDASKEWFEIPLDIKPIPNSTDALAGGVSPIKVTIANAVTTAY